MDTVISRGNYRKLDPLVYCYSANGKLRIARWNAGCGFARANAIALSDVAKGEILSVYVKDGFAEVNHG